MCQVIGVGQFDGFDLVVVGCQCVVFGEVVSFQQVQCYQGYYVVVIGWDFLDVIFVIIYVDGVYLFWLEGGQVSGLYVVVGLLQEGCNFFGQGIVIEVFGIVFGNCLQGGSMVC